MYLKMKRDTYVEGVACMTNDLIEVQSKNVFNLLTRMGAAEEISEEEYGRLHAA